MHFELEVPNLRDIESKPGGILAKFKLRTSISAANYVLFDSERKICRYASEVEILKEFFP